MTNIEYADGLRRLADFYETNPAMPQCSFGLYQEQRLAFIAKLQQQRADIDAALEALGAVRERHPKIGRPKGSRNKKSAVAVDRREATQR